MIITLSGKAGSGKGTIGKLLADKLNYTYISIGNMKRELAQTMGLSILEFNKLGELPGNQEAFDLKYEDYQKKLDLNDNIILDSRAGFFCQPKAFKVFLDVSDEEAAKRIFADKARTGDVYASWEEARDKTVERNQEDVQKFKTLYGISMTDPKNFDLIVDTTGKVPQQVAEEIIENFKNDRRMDG